MKKLWLPTFFIIVILSAALITFYWSYGFLNPYDKNPPKADKGVINLTKNNYKLERNIKLLGECEFYWNRLLEPSDFKRPEKAIPDGYFQLPGVWNKYVLNGKKLPSYGYATYRLFILVDSIEEFGLKIKEFDCSYKMWIDGALVAQIGKTASQPEQFKPSWKRKEIYFTNRSDTIEVIFQVANFIHRKGGPEDVMYFGRSANIHYYKNIQRSTSLFLMGVLFIMAFYHIVLFIYRPRDKSVLYFSLFSFLVLFRMLTTGEKLLLDFFPEMNFRFAVQIEYISYTIAVPVFFSFLNCFFSKKASKGLIIVIYVICAINVLIVMLFPIRIFSYTPVFYQFLVIYLAVYLSVKLIVDLYRKMPHTHILFGGYFFFVILVINDVLYYNQLINTSQLLPLGLFIMIFSQAFVLSRVSSVTFAQVEKLSSELEVKNKELEIKVIDRTREIMAKKEEIERQKTILEFQTQNLTAANQQLLELNQFKEGFTGMLVHDLKNPLNVILNLSKDNLVKYAGYQMLNLIHNLQDIQKYEHTSMQLEKSVQPISNLIETASEQVSYLRLKKNIDFVNNIHEQIEFEFDPGIIERVFINLLTNAIKYSPQDSCITIDMSISGDKIKFLVKDEGIGIPEDKQHVIFTKYGQIVARKSGQVNSLGLGLTFCKMAVEAHNGTIGFYANQPKGSVFWFELPFINGNIQENNVFSEADLTSTANESDFHFDSYEIAYLKPFACEIEKLFIFEITDINNILRKIDNNYSHNVSRWKKAVYEAANTINQNQFEYLIKTIIE